MPTATVGGGYGNRAGDDLATATDRAFATVAGGAHNVASAFGSTVAGGLFNDATEDYSTVGGGTNNTASADFSTVVGGVANRASGIASTAVGGQQNTAAGDYSVALGRRAKAAFGGDFVFADSSDFDFTPLGPNNFRVRATGGVRFVVGIDGAGGTTWTCGLANGDPGWICSSDRNQKQDLDLLDGRMVLDKLAAMPVYAWSPKGANSHVRHYGPTAQDFHATFGLGDTDLGIGQQDADGVALAAIQGLNAKLESERAAKDAEIAALRAELAAIRSVLATIAADRPTQTAVVGP